ncbi:hypothetical protein, partial [Chromobacterium alticapitis]
GLGLAVWASRQVGQGVLNGVMVSGVLESGGQQTPLFEGELIQLGKKTLKTLGIHGVAPGLLPYSA